MRMEPKKAGPKLGGEGPRQGLMDSVRGMDHELGVGLVTGQ